MIWIQLIAGLGLITIVSIGIIVAVKVVVIIVKEWENW